MPISSYGTFSSAAARARNRPPNTIALILGLEGARYYVFFSQPNLNQFVNREATKKINVAMQVEHFGSNLADGQLIRPSAVRAATIAYNAAKAAGRAEHPGLRNVHAQRRIRAADLTDLYLVDEARSRGIVQVAGHAEAFFIAGWKQCVADFIGRRKHAPRQGEVFLTHSPCRLSDANPSPAMSIGGTQYAVSCRSKLYTFFKANKSVRWKLWYALHFGSAEAINDLQLAQDFPGMAIDRMPDHLRAMMMD